MKLTRQSLAVGCLDSSRLSSASRPKTKNLRIQLKDELGHLLTPSASAQAYRAFFSDLYQSPTLGFLTEDLDLSWAEWFSALATPRPVKPCLRTMPLLSCGNIVPTYLRASLHLRPVSRLGLLSGRRPGFLALLPKPREVPSSATHFASGSPLQIPWCSSCPTARPFSTAVSRHPATTRLPGSEIHGLGYWQGHVPLPPDSTAAAV